MAIATTKWDAVDHLGSDEAIADYLEAVFEDGDPKLIFAALGDVVRAKKGMAGVSGESGVSRESLYRSLSRSGNPRFETVVKVMDALGFQLDFKTKRTSERTAA